LCRPKRSVASRAHTATRSIATETANAHHGARARRADATRARRRDARATRAPDKPTATTAIGTSRRRDASAARDGAEDDDDDARAKRD
jgi:hypothetical protein